MTTFRTVADIAAPPARVWEVMRDVTRWAEWTPSISAITPLTPGPFAVGSRVRIKQPRFPAAEWVVTALTEGEGFTWISRSPGVRVTADHRILPTSAGCRVTLSVTYAGLLGPLMGVLIRGTTERYLAMEAAGLTRRSEGTAPGG